MPCTVIRPEDMADRILDRDKHPQWQGERTKMVYSFPTNEVLWAKYAEIRAESLRAERGLADATEFYGQHREEMDAGAAIAWPERYNHDELSAIQQAMNLKLQDERAFWAEYQNEPLPDETPQDDELTADQVAAKINRIHRGDVPVGCNHLTMFVDVQAALLFYVVAAWGDDFTGYVIDYGAYPDQEARLLHPSRRSAYLGAGCEGRLAIRSCMSASGVSSAGRISPWSRRRSRNSISAGESRARFLLCSWRIRRSTRPSSSICG